MDALSSFLARHALSSFRHKRLLLDGLTSGEVALVHAPLAGPDVPGAALLRRWEARLATLHGRADGYSSSLRGDLEVLCAALVRHGAHGVVLWGFHVTPGFSLSVLECRDDGDTLGSVLAVEEGLTDAETFARFFGGG